MSHRLAITGLLAAAAIVASLGIPRPVRSHADAAGAYSFEPPVTGLRLPDAERAGIMGARGITAGLAPAPWSIRVGQAADGAGVNRTVSETVKNPSGTVVLD